MDLAKVLAELKRELADLDAAIGSLERLQTTLHRRGEATKSSSGKKSEGDASVEDVLLPAATVALKGRGRSKH